MQHMTKTMNVMYVTKRDGSKEEVSFDKISNRLKILINLKETRPLSIDWILLTQKICAGMYSGVKTSEIDEFAAETCASLITTNIEYGHLASRIAISNHHKKTSPSFSETMHNLYHNNSKKNIITKALYDLVCRHKTKLNQIIDYSRDFDIDYFGFKTLEKSYLLKGPEGNVLERPQHLFLRVALGIYGNDIRSAIACYQSLSTKKYIHATPTLFNAGTANGQLASCFLMGIKDDSLNSIYDAIKDCALISKDSGGIGIHISNIRAKGSEIGGGTGISNGIVPMLKVFNNTAKYVDQGGGKRNGSFAIYLEPWHADIRSFLELRKNQGYEDLRARDLFYALWIPDLFMRRVENDEEWTLMCPHVCPGLSDTYGKEFEELYMKYESEGLGVKVRAQDLWFQILESQVETGMPYMLFKDSANEKSNQKNLGVIKSSNLCCEIMEYTSPDETAVCNLASISLSAFVIAPEMTSDIHIESIPNCVYCKLAKQWCERWSFNYTIKEVTPIEGEKYPKIHLNGEVIGFDALRKRYPARYDYESLLKTTREVTRNLNKIIDRTTYPIESARRSNLRHRPIGIGVQGLANVFMMMRLPFDSDEARFINEKIFETMYYGAVQESMTLSKKKEEKKKGSGAYSSYNGSPMQQGKFQFDLWKYSPKEEEPKYDWEELRKDVQEYGIMNSLLISPMPTASTSQILSNNECFEPITSNIYARRTLAGEFILVNKYLQEDLEALGVWNEKAKDSIIANDGSVQHLEIPQFLKDTYKTVWELSQKTVIDLAVDRGKFICQSQSMNLFIKEAKFETITSMLFYSWKQGLKTGVYYLRTKPQSKTQQFTIAPEQTCVSCSG